MAGGKKGESIVVAQIMGKWVGGGVEAVIMNYYRHIDRTKVQFDFICDEDSTNIPYDEIEKLGGNVIICPPYQKIFKYMRFLKKLFREKKYRIVHSNINTLSVFPLKAAKKAGVPVRIAHSHSTSNPKETKKNIIKNILRVFSKKYATDYYACTQLAGEFQFGKKSSSRNEIKILPDAIDLESFKFDEVARKRIRKEFGYNDSDYVIGNVGRLDSAKNQLFLIDAFAKAKKENQNIKLLIIGEGKLREKIINKIDKLNLQKDIRVENCRKDINKCYSAMDIFAFPSIYEGFGMAAIEAQSVGLHVIASVNVPQDANIGNMERRYLNENFLENLGGKRFEYDIRKNAPQLQKIYEELGNA